MNREIEKVLNIIVGKLDGLNYAFVGSLNLLLQSITVQPRDIDILTNPDEINKIVKILKEYQTKEIYFDKSEGRNSYRAFFEINRIEIEILGNVNNICRPKDSLDKKILVDYKELKIPCIPLKEELKAYEKMSRKDKVELIKKKIKDNRSF